MDNLILFLNQFLSYILLMVIIVAVGGAGLAAGIKWRKVKDARSGNDGADAKQ